MIYILTEEEYDTLVDKGKKAKGETDQIINNLCTLVAAHMPIKYWGNDDFNAWGCPHYEHKKLYQLTYPNSPVRETTSIKGKVVEYCDKCPIKQHCTQIKRYSK